MPYRQPAYVHRNRHNTLYFRVSVPPELRALIGQKELYRSLRTGSIRDALPEARKLHHHFITLFEACHAALMTTSDSESSRSTLQIDLARLRELVRETKRDLRYQSKVEALDDENSKLALELAMQREQHARELKIAMETARGASATPSGPVTPKGSAGASRKTIGEVWELYKHDRIATGAMNGAKGGWKDGENTAKYDYWPHVRAFIGYLGGDRPISEVTPDDVDAFRTHIMTSAPGTSANTKNLRLQRVGGMFRWAKKKRIVPDAFDELFKLDVAIKKNNYLRFDSDDLRRIFESDDYKAGTLDDSDFWIPLLGLFTGGRLNELAQLRLEDITEHDGVPTISILDHGGRRLKNENSRRLVPIHQKLIEIGFLRYVQTIRDQRAERLFPSLTEATHRPGDFGRTPSRRFTDYRRKVGVGTDELDPATGKRLGNNRKVFHSFRSTLISALRDAGIPHERRKRLAGHEQDDTQNEHYDGGDALTMFPLPTLQHDINSAVFAVDFPRWKSKR